MRILHVVPTYLPAARYGGPIYSVHALCRALARRGHDVHVYTTNVDGPAVSHVSLTEPVILDGVKIRYFACGLGRRLYRSAHMGRALNNEISKFDIVHLHSVFLWPTLAAARAARRANVPYVLAPRGMLVSGLIKRKSRLVKNMWIKLFEQANVAGAAAIHVTSHLEQVELQKLNMPKAHVVVIANGIDPPDLAGRPSYSAVAQSSYVLSLGRINWKKGLDRLVRAMTFVPNVTLLIAGNDEDNEQPRLEALVRDLGMSDRVRFLGPIYGEKKWELLRRAAVFALPSYSENFGIAALEAMSCGCPVVVTPDVGLAQIIGEAGAGLIVDGEPEALGSSILALMSSPARRKAMGEAGRKLAAQMFSWSGIAEKMEHLYESCLRCVETRSITR